MLSIPNSTVILSLLPMVGIILLTLGGVASNSSPTARSQNCSSTVEMVLESALSGVEWAVEMVDASSKPQVGILRQGVRYRSSYDQVPYGSTQFLGNYDQCLSVVTTKDFGPAYCRADLQVNKIGHVSQTPPSRVIADICVPDICSGKDLVPVLQHYVKEIPAVEIIVNEVTCQEKQKPFTSIAIFVICTLSVLLLIIAAGTIYDLVYIQDILAVFKEGETITSYTQGTGSNVLNTSSAGNDPDPTKSGEDIIGQILVSFSLYTNISNLLSTHQPKGSLSCVGGIRVITSIWIIWSHMYFAGDPLMENGRFYWRQSSSRWSFQPIRLFFLAVDSFFVLSGLLSVYKIMKELQKEKPTLRYFMRFYLHRYWRLTPPYLLSMMAYVALYKHILDGPLWPRRDVEMYKCRHSWWMCFLYLSNFVKLGDLCIPWSWSVSLDMQYSVMSPLVILAFYYMDWHGMVVPLAMAVASALYCGVVTWNNQLPPSFAFSSEAIPYVYKIYINTIAHAAPYLVGAMTGYFLYKTDCKVKLSKRLVTVGWLLSMVVLFGVFAALYGHHNGDLLSEEMSALYNGLHKILWAFAISWVIIACTCGYGGIVNRILSWNVFVPFASVCYCSYLTNYVVIRYYFNSQRRLFYVSDTNMTFTGVACVVISMFMASVAYLLFEAPFANLEKTIRNIRKANKIKAHQN